MGEYCWPVSHQYFSIMPEARFNRGHQIGHCAVGSLSFEGISMVLHQIFLCAIFCFHVGFEASVNEFFFG